MNRISTETLTTVRIIPLIIIPPSFFYFPELLDKNCNYIIFTVLLYNLRFCWTWVDYSYLICYSFVYVLLGYHSVLYYNCYATSQFVCGLIGIQIQLPNRTEDSSIPTSFLYFVTFSSVYLWCWLEKGRWPITQVSNQLPDTFLSTFYYVLDLNIF